MKRWNVKILQYPPKWSGVFLRGRLVFSWLIQYCKRFYTCFYHSIQLLFFCCISFGNICPNNVLKKFYHKSQTSFSLTVRQSAGKLQTSSNRIFFTNTNLRSRFQGIFWREIAGNQSAGSIQRSWFVWQDVVRCDFQWGPVGFQSSPWFQDLFHYFHPWVWLGVSRLVLAGGTRRSSHWNRLNSL